MPSHLLIGLLGILLCKYLFKYFTYLYLLLYFFLLDLWGFWYTQDINTLPIIFIADFSLWSLWFIYFLVYFLIYVNIYILMYIIFFVRLIIEPSALPLSYPQSSFFKYIFWDRISQVAQARHELEIFLLQPTRVKGCSFIL